MKQTLKPVLTLAALGLALCGIQAILIVAGSEPRTPVRPPVIVPLPDTEAGSESPEPDRLPATVPPPEEDGHGARQLHAMLRDLPEMASVVEPGDEIWQWAVERFEGWGSGFRVVWDPERPSSWFSASSRVAEGDSPARIRIRVEPRPQGLEDTRARAWTLYVANEYWSRAAFELLNLDSSSEYQRIFDDALAGLVTREEYIERNARLEHAACLRLKEFYRDVWAPHQARAGRIAIADLWHIRTPDRFEDWVARYPPSPDAYPQDPFGKYFDTIIVPYQFSAER